MRRQLRLTEELERLLLGGRVIWLDGEEDAFEQQRTRLGDGVDVAELLQLDHPLLCHELERHQVVKARLLLLIGDDEDRVDEHHRVALTGSRAPRAKLGRAHWGVVAPPVNAHARRTFRTHGALAHGTLARGTFSRGARPLVRQCTLEQLEDHFGR